MTKLWAPAEYWSLTDEQVNGLVGAGGCGPGRFGDYLVPDTLWGLKVASACRIHDFCYHIGSCIEDKEQADRGFLNNMIRIILAKTKWSLLKRLRIRRARTYYWFVHECGGPAFWHGKNPPEEEGGIA